MVVSFVGSARSCFPGCHEGGVELTGDDAAGIPAAPGIYKITCVMNKKIYIGSALNLRRRKAEHLYYLRKNKHDNPILQNAWNKHGGQAFTFEVLELVLPMSITAREQYWFNKLKPFSPKGFNIAREAAFPPSARGKKRTPETIEKMRQASLGRKATPETIEKLRQSHLGHKPSPEAIEKVRQVHLGRKKSQEDIAKRTQSRLGFKHSPEAIEKMRQANLGRKRAPEAIEKARQANLGHETSTETREKISQALVGITRSPESIEKSRQARLGRKPHNLGKKLVGGKFIYPTSEEAV